MSKRGLIAALHLVTLLSGIFALTFGMAYVYVLLYAEGLHWVIYVLCIVAVVFTAAYGEYRIYKDEE